MSLLLLLGSGAAAPAPTYATWNPADQPGTYTLSGGDLIVTKTSGGTWDMLRATQPILAKSYFEVKSGGASNLLFGVARSTASLTTYLGGNTAGYGYYGNNGNKLYNAAETAYGAPFTDQWIGVSFDPSSGDLEFFLLGVSQGVISTGLTGSNIYPAISIQDVGNAATANFGESAFAYPVPSGCREGVYV